MRDEAVLGIEHELPALELLKAHSVARAAGRGVVHRQHRLSAEYLVDRVDVAVLLEELSAHEDRRHAEDLRVPRLVQAVDAERKPRLVHAVARELPRLGHYHHVRAVVLHHLEDDRAVLLPRVGVPVLREYRVPVGGRLGQHRDARAAVELLLVGFCAAHERHRLGAGVERQQLVEARARALRNALELLEELGRVGLDERDELLRYLTRVVPAHGGVSTVEERYVAFEDAVYQLAALRAVVRAALARRLALNREERHISHDYRLPLCKLSKKPRRLRRFGRRGARGALLRYSKLEAAYLTNCVTPGPSGRPSTHQTQSSAICIAIVIIA